MTADEIERILLRLGVPCYVYARRLPEVLGITPWKIRLAVESKSLKRIGQSYNVARHELAKWIMKNPEIRNKLLETDRDLSDKSDGSKLELTPAALDAGITVTVTSCRG